MNEDSATLLLGELRETRDAITRNRLRAASLREILKSIPSADSTQTRVLGGMSRQWEDCVVRLVDLENTLSAEEAHYEDLLDVFREGLRAVGNTLYISLLEARYLDEMTWSALAEREHYSQRHLSRLHNAALRALNEALQDGCSVA